MGVFFDYKSESEKYVKLINVLCICKVFSFTAFRLLDNLLYLTDRGGAELLRNSFHQESKIYGTEARIDH